MNQKNSGTKVMDIDKVLVPNQIGYNNRTNDINGNRCSSLKNIDKNFDMKILNNDLVKVQIKRVTHPVRIRDKVTKIECLKTLL